MPEWRSLSGRTIVIAAVVAVAIGGSATAWAMSSGDGASYRMASATTGTVQQTISATGTISPVHSSAADFQVAGTVKKVKVKVGQHVTVGQVLAWLDRSSLTSALRSARSTLAADRSRLNDDETGQSSPSSSSPTSATANNNRLLDASPMVVPSPSPTASPTNSTSGGSGPANSGSGSGSGSGSNATLQKDQQTVLADQQATDAALSIASRALAAMKSACSTAAAGQTGRSGTPTPTPSPSTAADNSACVEATTALAADQTTVGQAQQALAASEQKLNDDLAAALRSAKRQSTKSSPQKRSSSQGSVTPAATSSNVASAADLANDQAAIDQARASVASARADLREATLRSTIKGKVTAITVKQGDSVSGSSSSTSPAIQIVGAGQDQVTVALTASEVRHVKVGMTSHVSPDGVDHQLTGTVATIDEAGSESSSGSVSYPVTVTIRASTALVSGAAANVTVVVATVNDVLTLPTSAVHHSGTSTYVYVLKHGREVHRSITIGTIGAARTEIKSGLSAGQQVVLANLNQKVPSSSSTLTRNGGFGRNGLSDLTGGGGLTIVNGGGFPTGGVNGGPPSFSGK